MVLGTLFSSGAATGTGAPTTGMGVAVDAEGTGAAVDVCAAAEAGMEEVAEWDVGLAIAAAVEPLEESGLENTVLPVQTHPEVFQTQKMSVHAGLLPLVLAVPVGAVQVPPKEQ